VSGAAPALALRGLRRQDDPLVTDAAADIEEQVQRLDRVVNEVLDFARPIRFEVAPTDDSLESVFSYLVRR